MGLGASERLPILTGEPNRVGKINSKVVECRMNVEVMIRLQDGFSSFEYRDVVEPMNKENRQLLIWRDNKRTKLVAVFNEWVLWRELPPK